MVSEEHIREHIPVDPDAPFSLGRNINHDPKSAAYPFVPRRAVPIVSRDAWASVLPILDQASLGSCVPNTAVESLATGNFQRDWVSSVDYNGRRIDLTDPVTAQSWITDTSDGLYHRVTLMDPYSGGWLPDDTGSDGTSMVNLFMELGMLESFTHAFSGLPDVLQALNQGTVWMGSNWYDSMFWPNSEGILEISPNATVSGGHQYLFTGKIDADRKLSEIRNHWRRDWGLDGYAWMPWNVKERLLGEQGDAQILNWKVGAVPPFPPIEPSGCLPKFTHALAGRLSRMGDPSTRKPTVF